MQTLTKNHKLFRKFIDLLIAKCEFEEINHKTMWLCGHDYARTIEILKDETFENIDFEKTIEYFKKNGGFCDCEIIFNVDK